MTTTENPTPQPRVEGAEKPIGAIENGRVFFDRVEEQYSFECEAGPLNNCADWHEVKRCFEIMAEFISLAPMATIVDLERELASAGLCRDEYKAEADRLSGAFDVLECQSPLTHPQAEVKPSPSKMLWEQDAENAAAGAKEVERILKSLSDRTTPLK